MEFIHGKSIVDDAEARGLSTRQRLEVMALVADAVQHAHQRGIIHRDLKPSNILVDEGGQPNILDFGVALLTDADMSDSRRTDLGELVGTLAYMSPEQVAGDSLEMDARSDVYSLGVILYEMLAGKLPYSVSRKIFDSARIIREEIPVGLGRVNPAFRGDLEIIVAKSLQKDKAQRYSSAAELAADIRRYLSVEPSQARSPSLVYQLQKFARRHRALSIFVAVLLVVLLLGVAAIANQSIRASRAEAAALLALDRATSSERQAQADREGALRSEDTAPQERNRAVEAKRSADTQAAIATAVSDFLQGDLLSQAGASAQAGSSGEPDPNLKVRTALDRAAARISSKFGSQPEVEASLRQTMGNAYEDLGLYSQAQQQLESALALRQRVLKPGDSATLKTMVSLGGVAVARGKYLEAEALYNSVLEQNQRFERNPRLELQATVGLAQASAGRGDYPHAAALIERSLRALESPAGPLGPEDPAVLDAMTELTTEYANQGKYAGGRQYRPRCWRRAGELLVLSIRTRSKAWKIWRTSIGRWEISPGLRRCSCKSWDWSVAYLGRPIRAHC